MSVQSWGVRNDKMLATHPADGVTLPRARKAEHAMAIPSPGDVGQLLGVVEHSFRPFVAMCAFAGLRLGEAAAVRLDDINPCGGPSRFKGRSNGPVMGEVSITFPKYGSERLVHIPDGSCRYWPSKSDNIGVHSPSQWLFLGDGGLPPHQNTAG